MSDSLADDVVNAANAAARAVPDAAPEAQAVADLATLAAQVNALRTSHDGAAAAIAELAAHSKQVEQDVSDVKAAVADMRPVFAKVRGWAERMWHLF